MRVVTSNGSIELGTLQASPTIGITDYSRRVTDDFGVTTVVPRAFAHRMSVTLGLPLDQVDGVQATLAELRTTKATWVADERYGSLSFAGFYKDFELTLATALSLCTLTIEGTANTDGFLDSGGDPAPEGGRSSLLLVDPIAVTDAVLTSSSVAEADAPAWSAATTYAKGARVLRGAAHRIFESVVDGNTGHDPADAGGQWLDIGPTARWAAFDQALGSSTTAAEPIVVVLQAHAAITALAALDTNAATVRVQAGAYDRTIVPTDAGKALFLDLAVAAGASITVTLTPATGSPQPRRWDDGAAWMDDGVWRDSLAAGDGTITIGTMLLGALRPIGITEDRPTASIIDYSRKVTDDFGEVTVVPRSWAKKMAAAALIRTDAVDVVAGRLTAVRARPVLWIGQEGLDSLIVYGFVKDWEITVDPAVSKLSLSIEGLSTAGKVEPFGGGGSVAWPDITDPNGTKPTDNADKTSENTSKDTNAVGGKGAAELLADVAASKARQAVLDTVILPAFDAAIGDATTRINAARDLLDDEIGRAQGAEEQLSQRISTIQASAGGYDDGPIYARVQQVDTARADDKRAIGQRVDSVEAGIGTAVNAKASEITTAYTAADRQIADRATLLEASSRADTAMMNGNANFSDWPDSRGSVPSGWGLAAVASGATGNRVPGVLGRYALETGWPGAGSAADFFYAVSGLNFGDPYGGIDAGMFGGPGFYVMEADVTLVSGSLAGSGIYCASFNSNGVQIAAGSAHFPNHSANGGTPPGNGLPGARYKWAVLLDFTDASTRSFRFHPMIAWSGFGGSSPAKVLHWHKAGVRVATPEEIAARRADTNATSALARIAVVETATTDGRFATSQRTDNIEASLNNARGRLSTVETATTDGRFVAVQRVDSIEASLNSARATVTQQAGAIVDLQGRTASYVRFIADAGGGRAAFDLFADGYGGRWALTGDGLITGAVVIDGNVIANGTINARQIKVNGVDILNLDRSTMTAVTSGSYAGSYGGNQNGGQNYYGYVPNMGADMVVGAGGSFFITFSGVHVNDPAHPYEAYASIELLDTNNAVLKSIVLPASPQVNGYDVPLQNYTARCVNQWGARTLRWRLAVRFKNNGNFISGSSVTNPFVEVYWSAL